MRSLKMITDYRLNSNLHRLAQIVFIWAILCFDVYAQEAKQPVVAGAFYPADKNALIRQIDDYLDKAVVPRIDGDIYGLISPHAGYIYSGPVAAYGFKIIKDRKFDTVIVMAPTHYVNFKGIATGKWDFYHTPLGDIQIDKDFIKKLMGLSKIVSFREDVFLKEHSLEVQLPFLQRSLRDFKLLPLIVGRLDLDEIHEFAAVLESLTEKRNVLIVASSDLCHYLPYAEANVLDSYTLSTIEGLDVDKFYNRVQEDTVQLCGSMPVSILISLAKDSGLKAKILKYANSGDTAGDKSSVVGYASVIFYDAQEVPQKEGNMLNMEQKKRLLDIARKTIEQYLISGKVSDFQETDPRLLKEEGAFVTLKERGRLRGCIGNIYGRGPLYKTVRDMAIASATEDPRFPAVTKNELKDIEIEISVLSVPESISDVNKIQLGKHGVIVKKGFNSGVFLPQVASETGWTREEFLSNLSSHKAGLSPDAWKDKNTQIYIFTAQVFSEKEIE